jgi:Ca2+-binding EF-hand superfamily protein
VAGTTEDNEKTENCSEVKFVRDTDLTYTVHFYYVSPTFFEDTGDSTLWEHPTHSQSNADLTALNTAMNAGSGSAAGAQGSENYTYQKQGAGSDPAELAKTARGNSAKAASRKQSLDGSLGPGGLAAAVEGSYGSTAPPFLRRSKSLSAASASLLGISAADFFAEDESGPDALQVSDRDCVLIGSRMTLREYIVSRLDELRNEFERVDGKGAGVVTKFQWVNVMRQGMGLHLRWISIMQLLVLDRHFRSAHGKKMVDYREFLGSFEEEDGTAATGFGGAGRRGESAKEELGGELVDDEFTAVLKGAPAAAASAGGSAPGLQTSAVQVELPQSLHSPRDDVSTDGSEAASKLSPQRPQAEGSPSKVSGVSRKRVSFMCEDSDIPATATDSKHATGEQTSDGAVPANGKSISVSASGRPAPAAAVASSGSGAPGADAAEVPPLKTFGNHNISPELMEVLYIDYKEVEAAFAYFDRDCDGAITHSEFRAACRELNKYLPRGQKIRDVEALLALMDFEETGEILFNNFFELFRLSEMKLNVAIDEEDTLTSNLHHSENRDLVRRASAISMGGSFYASNTSKLAVHGVEINIDSEFTAKASDRVAASEAVGLNIDV